MSLEQLMALAARLNTAHRSPGRPSWRAGAGKRPHSYSLSAQEWAELFPETPDTPAPARTAAAQPREVA